MKNILIAFFMAAFVFSCGKRNTAGNCSTATIVDQKCGASWNIKLPNGDVHHSYNIPTQFRQPGLVVCIDYELYSDPAMCACCGGTAIRILSIQ
jgi:hypothetical protein